MPGSADRAADDFAAIRARRDEIERERQPGPLVPCEGCGVPGVCIEDGRCRRAEE